MGENKEFTQEEKKYIFDNWDFLTFKEIMEDLNTNRYRLKKFAELNGLKIRKSKEWNPKLIEQIHKLLETKTPKEVAKITGVESASLYRYLNKNDINWKNQNWSDDDINFVIKNCGFFTSKEIANQVGFNEEKIRNLFSSNRFKTNIKDGDYFTIVDIANILNIYIIDVLPRLSKQKLNVVKIISNDIEYYGVLKEEFMNYLYINKDKWNANKLKLDVIEDEPLWLKEKRLNDEKLYDKVSLKDYERSNVLRIPKIVTITGISSPTLLSKWAKRGLKLQYSNHSTPRKPIIFVDKEDLLEFMIEHPDLWDIEKVDKSIFNHEHEKIGGIR